jgi:(p)ppGpp synthase/HD superfamily hydrolase
MEGMIGKAMDLAMEAHAGAVDKGGAPYIGHPMRVAALVEEVLSGACTRGGMAGELARAVRTTAVHADDAIATAWLHDTVEDTWVSLAYLSETGFADEVVDAVDSLTRRDGETYADFVARASMNGIGRIVKAADIIDNCDLSRMPDPTERDIARVEKRYKRAFAELIEAIRGE